MPITLQSYTEVVGRWFGILTRATMVAVEDVRFGNSQEMSVRSGLTISRFNLQLRCPTTPYSLSRSSVSDSKSPSPVSLSTIVGIIALLFGASGGVGQLQTALNTISGVAPKPGQGLWGFIRQRFLAIGFLLLVSLVITAVKRNAVNAASASSSSASGATGSLITVLLWVYYSSLIFFLGAEFTQI